MKSHDTTEYQPRCPICDYSGKKVAAHINEEHFRGGGGGKRDKTEVDADNNEEFPSLALESGEDSEPNIAAKRTASTFKLAAKKSSFLSEWRCAIWEVFNRTLFNC